jgi:hypothetical protein
MTERRVSSMLTAEYERRLTKAGVRLAGAVATSAGGQQSEDLLLFGLGFC